MKRSYELLNQLYETTKEHIPTLLKQEIKTHLDIQKKMQEDVTVIDEKIIKIVSEHFFLPDIERKTRKREYVEARQIVYLLQKHYNAANFTLERVGRLLNQDHATVLHGIKTMEDLCEIDKHMYSQVSLITKKLEGVL